MKIFQIFLLFKESYRLKKTMNIAKIFVLMLAFFIGLAQQAPQQGPQRRQYATQGNATTKAPDT